MRLAGLAAGTFDYVRIDSTLRQPLDIIEARTFGIEHLDEGAADDLPLLLGIVDSGQFTEEGLFGINPSSTSSSPTWARNALMSPSTIFDGVHRPSQPHTSRTNRRSISPPWRVCVTSGWNCTPYQRRASSAIAAIGQVSVQATARNPLGRATTLSPCDIHTSSDLPPS